MLLVAIAAFSASTTAGRRVRAAILSASTVSVISSAAAQASDFQSSNGLIANWKITTGRFAIGAFMSVLKNWLLSAVKSNGAVSPDIRATASRMPVVTPPRTAFSVTFRITFHIGAPSATAASRRLPGTSRSMFSVVRTTTGIAISASAIEPAQPEK